MNRLLPLTGLLVLLALPAAADTLPVDSVLVRLVDEVEVPAQAAGVLASIQVREGDSVEMGAELARIDDGEAKLVQRRAELDLEQAQHEAANDVRVRFARKSAEVAQAELGRAHEARERAPRSVSPSELDALRLGVERSKLEIEQAQHEQELVGYSVKAKQNELDFAAWNLERRRILSPLGGVVVQVGRSRGEWVEPGESVFRIIRLDLLRAEGFLNVADLRHDLTDRPVTVAVPGQPRRQFAGKIVFVSPEVDPVNEQVRVWAEIENPELWLRPGMQGRMEIDLTPPAATEEPRPSAPR